MTASRERLRERERERAREIERAREREREKGGFQGWRDVIDKQQVDVGR